MIAFLKRMWAAAPVATVVLLLAVGTTGFFGFRAAADWVYWNDPAHSDQPIEGWMTPGYVSHSWQVPREVVIEALGGPFEKKGPRPIRRIAIEKDTDVEALSDAVIAAITAYRATQPQEGSSDDN